MIPYKLLRIASIIRIAVSKQQTIQTAFKSKENFNQFLEDKNLLEEEFWKLLYGIDQKYIDWIAREWYAGNYRFPEDFEAAKRRLQEFKKFKPRLNKLGLPTNILEYTKDELIKTLKRFEEEAPKLRNEVREKKIDSRNLPGVKKVQGGQLLIYEISDPKSLTILAQDPEVHIDWCVRHEETAEDYIAERGTHYLFIKDGKNYILGSFTNQDAEFKFPDDDEINKATMDSILPTVMRKIYPDLPNEKKLGFLIYLFLNYDFKVKDFKDEVKRIYETAKNDTRVLITLYEHDLIELTKEDLLKLAKNPQTCLRIKTEDPEIIKEIKITAAYSNNIARVLKSAQKYGAWDPNTEEGKVALFQITKNARAATDYAKEMRKPWDPNSEFGKKALKVIVEDKTVAIHYASTFLKPWNPKTEIGKKALAIIEADPAAKIKYYAELDSLPSPNKEGTMLDELKSYFNDVFSQGSEEEQYKALSGFFHLPGSMDKVKVIKALRESFEENTAALGPKLAFEAYLSKLFSKTTISQLEEIAKRPKEFLAMGVHLDAFFTSLPLPKLLKAKERVEKLFQLAVPKETIREIIGQEGFKYLSWHTFEKQMDALLKDFNIDLEKIKKVTPKEIIWFLESIFSYKMPGISSAAAKHLTALDIEKSKLSQEMKNKLIELNAKGGEKQIRDAVLNYVGRDKFTKEELELLENFRGLMDFAGKKIKVITKTNALSFLLRGKAFTDM